MGGNLSQLAGLEPDRIIAVAPFDGPFNGLRASPPNPDRRTRRTRSKNKFGEFDMAAVVRTHIVIKQLVDDFEGFVGNGPTLAWVHAQGFKFRPHPADPSAKDKPLAREFLEGGHLLGHIHGGPVGKDQDGNTELNLPGQRGKIGQRCQRLKIAAPRAFGLVRRNG